MEITDMTVHELVEKLKNKELTSEEITQAYINRIEEKENDIGAFVTKTTEDSLEKAKLIDNSNIDREQIPFAGIPIIYVLKV